MQYDQLNTYPIQYQQRECYHSNHIMDFQIDLGVLHKPPTTKAVNGVGSQQFGFADRKYVQDEIRKRWNIVAPDIMDKIPKPGFTWCRCIWLIAACLTMGLAMICHMCYIQHIKKKGDKLAIKWRDLFIKNMQDFIHNDLKIKYPHLTFTLIYPVCIYQTLVTVTKRNGVPIRQTQRPIITNVWCYIRISKCVLPLGDSYEPTVDTTANQNDLNNAANNTTTVIHIISNNQNQNYESMNESIGGIKTGEMEEPLIPSSTNT